MKKNENETNSEDNSIESNEDKNSDVQAADSNSQNSAADKYNQSLTRKTSKRPNSNVKIEEYDLIVSSLKEATTSFKDVIFSIGKKAQIIRDKAEETFTVGSRRDARDIQALGIYVESVTKGFEDTMM
jgi:hypothetical protein